METAPRYGLRSDIVGLAWGVSAVLRSEGMSNKPPLITKRDPPAALHRAHEAGQEDQWLARALRCIDEGVITTGLDACIRSMNPAAQQFTGWTIEEALGQPVGEVLRYRPSPGSRTDARDAATAEDPVDVSGVVLGRAYPEGRWRHGRRLVTRDRHERLVDEWVGPISDDSGTCLGVVLVLRDASVHTAQEKLLSVSEQRFRNAFDFAPLGMALISPEGDFLLVNDAFCALLGAPREEVKLVNHDALTLEGDLADEVMRRRQIPSEPAGSLQFEKRYRRLDGREPVSTLVSVCELHIANLDGCYLYQVLDLTEQKKASAQLADLAEQRMRLEATELANQAKRAFMSRASHEMRTPLNAVMGFAQLLQLDPQPDAAHIALYAAQILQAGERLLALVNDLLDLQRTVQGTKTLTLTPVDIAAAAEAMRQLMEPQASAQHVVLDMHVPQGLSVMADPTRLRQVLRNLLSNALKFNRTGGSIKLAAETRVPGEVRLTIEDSGIGMTPAQIAQLFQPFDRLGRENSPTPGVGLGLLIARSLVLEMGGSMEVFSEVDRGTLVAITLPAGAAQPQ